VRHSDCYVPLVTSGVNGEVEMTIFLFISLFLSAQLLIHLSCCCGCLQCSCNLSEYGDIDSTLIATIIYNSNISNHFQRSLTSLSDLTVVLRPLAMSRKSTLVKIYTIKSLNYVPHD